MQARRRQVVRIMIPFAVLLISTVSCMAAVRLPSVLADNMVLQRNGAVTLWGWSNANEGIEITTSWDGHTYSTRGTRQGKWSQQVATPAAGGPYSITVKGSNTIELKNILIGEVWVCSGQSNMAWSANSGIDNAEEAVAAATENQLRFFQIPRTTADYPQDDCPGSWEVCTPESMRSFSAVAYYFGRHLTQEMEGVPIGLIQSAWGGTPVEVWTPKETIASNEAFQNWDLLPDRDGWPKEPARCFNAMIYPITNLAIAGAIWYQGESNVANSKVYRDLFPAMIESWRDYWKSPFPFYFVQIAPYNYGRPFSGASLREAQVEALKLPRTGMAVVSDIGNYYDIHPTNKEDVGIRLANMALNRSYGYQRLDSGPLYKGHEIKNNQVIIDFDYGEGLASRDGAPLSDFKIAGEDQIFFDANAVINGGSVILTSDYVPNPVAARFAFENLVDPNLINAAGLPASTFRTDDWPILVKQVGIKVEYDPVGAAYQVQMNAGVGENEIRYTTNGDHPGLFGLVYRGPFYLDSDCTIRAIAMTSEGPSNYISEREVKITKATFRSITYDQQNFGDPYRAGGTQALVDGITGTENHRDGNWQGFQNHDMSVVIDFGAREPFTSVKMNAFKNQKNLIFLPKKVSFSVSNDGERYTEIYRKPMFHTQDNSIGIETFEIKLRKARKSRYLKVTAETVGKAPAWHAREGQKVWMLLDEIEVN